jgi:hypothetical protein
MLAPPGLMDLRKKRWRKMLKKLTEDSVEGELPNDQEIRSRSQAVRHAPRGQPGVESLAKTLSRPGLQDLHRTKSTDSRTWNHLLYKNFSHYILGTLKIKNFWIPVCNTAASSRCRARLTRRQSAITWKRRDHWCVRRTLPWPFWGETTFRVARYPHNHGGCCKKPFGHPERSEGSCIFPSLLRFFGRCAPSE